MGMGALAQLLKNQDMKLQDRMREFFPPMSEVIKGLKIITHIGYSADNISSDTDVIIVGNAITRENIEAQEAMKSGKKVLSMPQAMYEYFLKIKTPVIISGTHGKTTTTLMLSWILEDIKENPSFFCGRNWFK
jgi:UDP-N-acetylmuramate: L-alanyl-gamma-D-glutamyl-meso-diaminopimelate ligase